MAIGVQRGNKRINLEPIVMKENWSGLFLPRGFTENCLPLNCSKVNWTCGFKMFMVGAIKVLHIVEYVRRNNRNSEIDCRYLRDRQTVYLKVKF